MDEPTDTLELDATTLDSATPAEPSAPVEADNAATSAESVEDAALKAIESGKQGNEVVEAARAAQASESPETDAAPEKTPTDSAKSDSTPAVLDDATKHLLSRWKCDPDVVAAMPEAARTALIAQLDAQAKVMDQVFRERAELRKQVESGGKPPARQAEPKQAQTVADGFDLDEETVRELEDNFGTGSKAVIQAARKIAEQQNAQLNVQLSAMWRQQELRDEQAGFAAALEGAPPSLKSLAEKPETRTKIIDTAMAILKAEAAKPGFDIAKTNLSTAIPQAFRAMYATDLQKHEQFKLAQSRARALRSQPDRSGLNNTRPQQSQRTSIEDIEDRVLEGIEKGVRGSDALRTLAFGG